MRFPDLPLSFEKYICLLIKLFAGNLQHLHDSLRPVQLLPCRSVNARTFSNIFDYNTHRNTNEFNPKYFLETTGAL